MSSRPFASNRRLKGTEIKRRTPRRSTGGRALTLICSKNCCAARAITMPTSSLGPNAQAMRSASCSLPSLESAGPETEKLRNAFGVKAGDPVIAADVIGAGLVLRTTLGEQGYASARIGEQEIEVDHQTHLASLTLPVDPGPIARFGRINVSGRQGQAGE